jgi:TonB family protein
LIIEEPWQIRGPASKRKVVFKPPQPSLQLKATVEIELKFWVLPDGAIGRVIPTRRGDPTLEGEMMAYLKKWRFSSLPPDAPQEEQWGTIPIRYLLK